MIRCLAPLPLSRCNVSWGTFAHVVQAAVPTIYAPPIKPLRLSLAGRLLALGVFVACVTLMYTAIRLTPSPEGVGTHRAMGFYPCNMLVVTGIPCPTCGMTTSFAWFYRAELMGSLYVQPCGFVLAYLVAITGLGALYEVLTARPIHRILRVFSPKFYILSGSLLFTLGWAWKIMLQLRHVDGWPLR